MRLAAVGMLAGLLACAKSDDGLTCPSNVPPSLAPKADQELVLVLRAEGLQRYACSVGSSGHVWALVLPDAKLFDHDNKPAGTHFAGPSWQHTDGSSAVGRKVALSAVDKTAIPWLLLDVSSHNGKPGVLADVTMIQRLDTVGGLAPAAGCDSAFDGKREDVPYTAKYYFYRKTTKANPKRCGG